MKYNIIAHRGGAGMALENSSTVLKQAVALGVPMIEIDVRLTADKQLVLSHDATLRRVAGDSRKIRRHTYHELQDVRLKDGSPLLRLADALAIIGTTPVIIELKDTGSAQPLAELLKKFPKAQVSVSSFVHQELMATRKLQPGLLLYAATIARPFHTIQLSERHELGGVALFWGLLSPLAYWYAQRRGVTIFTWTVNNRFVMQLIRRLYPGVLICTDRPDQFMR